MYVYLVGVVLSIPLGIFIDWFGNRRYSIILSAFLFTASHLLFFVSPQCQNGEANNLGVIPFILLGISYTFYSNVLIPSISQIVPKKDIGTAFGVLLMYESISLSLLPYLSGIILQKSPSH